MASSYPAGLDSFATTRADATAMATIQKDDHNNYADAINKIETELGVNPSGASATVVARLDALAGGGSSLILSTTQAGTTYTLALGDAATVVEFTSSSAVTVTVPPNSTVAFPTGSTVGLCATGTGQVTVAQGAGVTIRSPGSKLKLSVQYSSAWLRKRATNEWVLEGDLSV